MKKYIFIFLFFFICLFLYDNLYLSQQIILSILWEEVDWSDFFYYFNFNIRAVILPSLFTWVLYLFEKSKFQTSKYVQGRWLQHIHSIWIGTILIWEITRLIIVSDGACSVDDWMYITWAVIGAIEMIWMIVVTMTDIFFSRWYWLIVDLIIIMILFIWLWMSFFGLMCG